MFLGPTIKESVWGQFVKIAAEGLTFVFPNPAGSSSDDI
jgi:hypothetical protein